MKIKIKQTFRSMWATILAVLMLLSTFSAVAVTLNTENSGAQTDVESVGANLEPHFYFIGGSGSWTNGTAINKRYNSSETVFYIDVNLNNGEYFALANSATVSDTDKSNQYGPSNDGDEIGKGSANKMLGTYGSGATGKAWKYTGTSGNVRIFVDERDSISDNQWKPYVWYDDISSTTSTQYYYTSSATNWTSNTALSKSTDETYQYFSVSNSGVTFKLSDDENNTNKYGTNATDYVLYDTTTIESDGVQYHNFKTKLSGTHYIVVYPPNSANHPGSDKSKIYVTASATLPNTNHNLTVTYSEGSVKVNDTEVTSGTATAIAEGDVYTVSVTPPTGKAVNTFTVGGEDKTSALINNTYTGTMGNSDVAINVTFKKAPYTVTLTSSPSTGGSITGKIGDSEVLTNLEGTKIITLTASANTGYSFKEWQVTGTANIASTTSAVTDATVTDACTITAVFEEIPKVATSVTLTAEPNTVEKNDPITLTATLNTPATGAENITYKFEKTSGSTGNFTGEVENTTSTTATFTPTATGTYKFKVTASCNGFTSVVSPEISVTVTEPVSYYIGGRFDGNKWDHAQKTMPLEKVSTGLYKYVTGKTVGQLSEQISESYGASDPLFFIHTGSGYDSATWYGTSTSTPNYHNFDKCLGESNAMTLTTFSQKDDNANNYIMFANKEDNSGPVTIWFDVNSKKLWYTIPEAVKYEISKSGTNTDKFDTKVNSVSVREASAGATVTIEINPEAGYEVDTVQVVQTSAGGEEGYFVRVDGDGNSRTFTMPESKVSVRVTFKLKAYTMTGKANPSTFDSYVKCYDVSDTDNVTEIPTATKGQRVKFVATAVSGYSVSDWTIEGSSSYVKSGNTVTVTVETSDVTATANYVGDYFNIVKNDSSNGSYTVTGTGVVNNTAQCGSTVTITPTADPGYELESITVRRSDGLPVTVTNNSFTMPAYNVTITVTFKSNPGTTTQNKFLYKVDSNDPSQMVALTGTVYENPKGTFTLTITDASTILRIVDGNNTYFALSSTSSYTNMYMGSSNGTETSTYISSTGIQKFNKDGVDYYFLRASFAHKDQIKSIKLIFDSSTSKYTINAYDVNTDAKHLADGVTLEATPTEQTIGKNVTLTATLNNVNAGISNTAEFTYTFYRGSEVLGTVTRRNEAPIAPVTFDTKYNTASTQRYTVTVSTNDTYDSDNTPTNYESVTSEAVSVTYKDIDYYYAAVDPETGAVDTRKAIPADNKVETTVSDGGTYYFSVFDNDTDTSAESVVDYTVDSANNRYCTITKSSTETGLDYFIVKCNAKCSKPVIYFNKANKTVYAVATQNVGSSKTLDNSEKKVTYYFAEERHDSTTQSNPENGGEGMRIKYWNNSVNNSTCVDVTTKVIRPGTDNDGTSAKNNSIFVFSDKFAGISTSDLSDEWINHYRREFYIYSVDLPIWATSFSFVDSNDNALTINNTSQIPDQGTTTTASIVLNPNRVYCFMHSKKNTKNYVRGVVLDDSLWDGKARTAADSNEMVTQGFASNLVNYNTKKGDRGTTGNSTVNNELTTQYGSDYQHPLYFNGWYNTDDENSDTLSSIYGTSNFKLHDNLAMRHDSDAKYYFASIQNLTDNRLSTAKKNEMGNGYLLGYNGSLMPMFNYEMLKTNPSLVYNNQLYENVQFPFYASTFDGVTTYSYDSTTDRNRLVETEGGKTTVNVSSSFVQNGNSYGYFPFGGTGDYDTYGFGTEFDINFYMTNNGKLSNGDDIAFNFSGDDDVWVYVDGVRVLDLGGAHSVSSGTINFSDMKVYYKTAANVTDNVRSCKEAWAISSDYVKTVSLKDLFEANGVSFSNTDASTQHTLQMFYLERGEGESNCSISFNLPQNTGFRVNSNVTTNNVNEALVQDTMASANKDYFNYQIANKLATSGDNSEYSKITAKFPNAHAPAGNTGALTRTTLPNYPINTISINRDFLGTKYFLTAKSEGISPAASDNTWLDSVNRSTFTTLKNVNYTLSDAYAVKGASDTESSPSGRVSGTGIFNLLFGQSALFESKIPNNTMIQLSQDDKISTVNPGVENSSVITAGDDSTKTVSDYYSSSYSIIDDNTGLELANKTQTKTDGKLYANDASDNSNMFYFANYSGDATASSNAMTVTYTNDVLTSKIKLAKYVQNPSATDNFYFKVVFSKIFGETLDSSKEYTDLQYKVYNSADDSPVATRTYGKAGVYFTAKQYAIIEGVPVDSAYKVVEKDRAGYKFVNASKTTYNGKTAGDPVSFTENSVEGKTVSGTNGTTTYDAITFNNKKELFTVNFKYYDRSVITGTTSHISTSPTTVTYSYASLDGYTTDSEGRSKYELEALVADAYAYYKFDNVIDTYKIFTSQSAAKDPSTGAGSLTVLREDLDGVTPGEKPSYSSAYPRANLSLHYDCYGRPQGTVGCNVKDGEDWVTYYNGSTKLSQAEASAYGAKVTSITVWLYNTLKEYRPTFYFAPESATSSQLTAVTGTTDRYVATTTATQYTIPKNVYYNVRLGGVNGNAQNDAATEYLNEYGITKGYCNEIADISSSVTYNGDNLKFLYWASDPSGKTILSTDIAYGYRVTNHLKAYAVYGLSDFNAKGLTITPNTPDYYSNSNGKALVRLNNVMNVYGCPERDTNIKKASIIYIVDYSTNNAMDNLLEQRGGFKALQDKVREVVNQYEASNKFVEGENIVIQSGNINFTKDPTGDIDITGFNHKVVPYNEELKPGTDDIKLTNKNRVQFTTSFTKSNLIGRKMYAMLGMDYAEVVQGKNSEDNSWIVSDNLLYYEFGATSGDVAIIKDPILGYEFYKGENVS